MLKKLIIMEKEQYQSDTLQDIVKVLIDENYYNMTQLQKIEKMKKKALANCINNKVEIVNEDNLDDNYNIDGKFIIKDEFTYILSLLAMNKIILLERKDSDIFIKYLNKQKFENNYVVVNKFAKTILKKYLIASK